MYEQELQDIGKCLKNQFPGARVSLQGIWETDFEFILEDTKNNSQVSLVIPVETLMILQSRNLTYAELFQENQGKSFIDNNPDTRIYHYTTGFTLVHA